MEPRRAMVSGTEVRLWDAGDGEPVLFLHGSSGAGWTPFLEMLSGSYRVLAPEHPGYGETPAGWVKTIDDMSLHYLRWLLEHFPDQRVHLIGHSLGGWIASQFAIRHSDRLASLVLIAPAGLRIDAAPMADFFVLPAERLRELAYHDTANAPASDPTSVTFIRNRAMTAQLTWHPRLFDPRMEERLGWIGARTLVVWGESDGVLDPRYADRFAERIPDAEKTLIAEAGHYPHVEQSQAVVDAVTSFLGAALTPAHGGES